MNKQTSVNDQVKSHNTSPCEFCFKLQPKFQNSTTRHWYDFHIIMRNKHFVAVAALGSIVPGYLIIVSRKHMPSMAHLSLEQLISLENFIKQISALQTNIWAAPVVFEHGACDDERTAGSCITHAHMHIVPGDWDLLPKDASFKQFASITEFAKQHNKKEGYLLFHNHLGTFVSTVNNIESQLLRKRLAAAANVQGQWDYVVFPFFDNMQETIERLNNVVAKANMSTPAISPTIHAYNEMAKVYYEKTKYLDSGSDLRLMLEDFIRSLKGRLILDAGAGSCRDTVYLIGRGARVEAIDLAEELLRASSSTCPNYLKRVMDIRTLAYPDETFDGIWCSAVLLHFTPKNVVAALEEFFRVLKPDGILHLSVKEGKGKYKAYVTENPRVYREFYLYNKSEIVTFLNSAGFQVKSIAIDEEVDSNGEFTHWIRCLSGKSIENTRLSQSNNDN